VVEVVVVVVPAAGVIVVPAVEDAGVPRAAAMIRVIATTPTLSPVGRTHTFRILPLHIDHVSSGGRSELSI
jgi:hypothetical protein